MSRLWHISSRCGLFTLGLAPTMGNHPVSIPPTRTQQCERGPGVQGDKDIGWSQGAVPRSQQILGNLQHGCVCQLAKPSTSRVHVHQLEARSGGNEHRYILDQLEESGGICIPTLCLDRQMLTEDKGGTEYNNIDCSRTNHGFLSCWRCW